MILVKGNCNAKKHNEKCEDNSGKTSREIRN